jgi:amino acid permease
MTKLIAREEIFSGGIAGRLTRQASALLIAIENRTAYLTVQAQHALDEYPTETSVQERNRAFLEAIAAQRAPPVAPTSQALERWAPQWALLVPDNPNLRAALAHLLGQKYRWPQRLTPRLAAALGLESAAVQAAHQQLYNAPLATIFAPSLTLGERLQWLSAGVTGWFDELSPFWTAFALTLTNTVGSSILALPIALAGVGPLAGVVILVALGLVNVLTIALMAETFTRTGSIRYGKSFVRRVVSDYLGAVSATVLSVSTLFYCILALIAYYIGFATTLAAATPLPAPLWAGLLFLGGLYFVRRKSLNATVASALVIGAVNIGLILLLALLALRQAQPANLLYVRLPWLHGQPFDPAILRLILGVVLGVYTSHLSVSNCAKAVLRRDPSGRSLLHGTTSALLTAIVLFCIWVVAVNGAIPPSQLAREPGTALIPLARTVGPWVHLFGTIYVFLAIGMISVHAALGLMNLTHEWLAKSGPWFTGLPKRGQALLLFAPLLMVFLLAEWLLISGAGSFTQINSLRGALIAPLLAGIFPILLLLASRRKGEMVPEVVYRCLGRPWLLAGIYLLFGSSIVLHGLVFWPDLPRQMIALAVGGLLLGLTIWLTRHGLFARRLVIEMRQDQRQGDKASFAITAGGEAATTTVSLDYGTGEEELMATQGSLPRFAQLRQATFHWLAGAAHELKVWVHKVTPEGDSIGLDARVCLQQGEDEGANPVALARGQTVLPLAEQAATVTITLS